MKKLITLSVIVLSSFGAFITFTNETSTTSESYKNNGKAGYTGSPGEANCTSCHGSFSLNSGGGSVSLTSSDMVGWQYESGVTYNMRLVVRKPGVTLFGFGLEILNSSNTNGGTINVTDAVRSQIISSGGRSNLVHKLSGGTGTDSTVINFTWTAPATDTNAITCYFMGAATNGDNSDNSDYIYSGTQVCTHKAIDHTGINDKSTAQNITIFPNQISDKINIQYNNQNMQHASINIIDMQGKVVANLANNITLIENTQVSFDKPTHLTTGIYYLHISNGTQSKTTRIVVL